MKNTNIKEFFGGDESVQINQTLEIRSNEIKIEEKGMSFLSSGWLETDIGLYPDAVTLPLQNSALIETVSLTPTSGYTVQGACVDDTTMYVLEGKTGTINKIQKYNKSDNNKIGSAITITNTPYLPTSICVDDNYLYVGSKHRSSISIYDKNNMSLIQEMTTPYHTPAIAVDENFIYSTIWSSPLLRVVKFDKISKQLVNEIPIQGSVTYGYSISCDDYYLYIGDTQNIINIVSKETGLVTTVPPTLLSSNKYIEGIDMDDTHLFVSYLEGSEHKVDKFTIGKAIGIKNSVSNLELGTHTYIRIK